MTRQCCDCPTIFIHTSLRAIRCPSCKAKRHAEQKLESQRKLKGCRRRNDPADIPAAEIEARFQAALKEAKQASYGLEPFRSYSWLYKEPRS